MNCDETIELLPWLLNGTLKPAEERRVREHLASCARCRDALEDTRFAWWVFDEHAATEDLVAYAFEDRPPVAGADAIERHVAECPRCAAELEMVRASRLLGAHEEVATFPVRPAVAPVPAARGRYRAWRSGALAASLVGLIAASGWFNSSERARSLAAQLAAERDGSRPPAAAPAPVPATSAATAEQIARLEQENRRLAEELAAEVRERPAAELPSAPPAAPPAGGAPAGTRPEINPVLHNLYPADAVERGEGEGEDALPVPAASERVILILNSCSGAAGERGVEIAAASGQVVWSRRGLVCQPEGYYALSLPRSFLQSLKSGRYSVRVLGASGEPARIYPLTVG